MRNRRRVGWIVIAALLGFSCAPIFSPSLMPTLGPSSLSTAIARTAEAASAQTAAPSGAQPILSGPTLDANSLNTMIAQTADAAATQTAGLIPPTLTPSMTPFPTWTPTITPLPTHTFFITIPPTATKIKLPTPKPTATKKHGRGDGGGGGGGGKPQPYACKVSRVSPTDGTVIPPDTDFKAFWVVVNKASDWPGQGTDFVFDSGALIHSVSGYDFNHTVSGGDEVALPNDIGFPGGVDLRTPSQPGTYSTSWRLHIGNVYFCDMSLTIVVQ